jgi:hypothetical protein
MAMEEQVEQVLRDLEQCIQTEGMAGSAIGEEAYTELFRWVNWAKPMTKKVADALVRYQKLQKPKEET